MISTPGCAWSHWATVAACRSAKQLDHPMTFQINQDRAGALALAEGPVITT
jgi:hypothetical protein